MESGRYQPKVSDTHRLYCDTLRKEGSLKTSCCCRRNTSVTSTVCIGRHNESQSSFSPTNYVDQGGKDTIIPLYHRGFHVNKSQPGGGELGSGEPGCGLQQPLGARIPYTYALINTAAHSCCQRGT